MATYTWLLAALSLTGLASCDNDLCPSHLIKNNHLIQYHSSCYEFVLDHPGNWHVAQNECRTKGGHLVDIHSYGEEGFLFNSMQFLGFHGDKGVWIGLTDEHNEGHWAWTSGKPVTFTNWAKNQPGMVGGLEDCAILQFSDHGAWHDYPCDGILFLQESHGWICEYAIVES